MSATRTHTVSGRASNQPGTETHGPSLEVVVLHTSTKQTLGALRTAATLAKGLNAQIRLLVLEVVPYPLSLEAPHITLEFTHRHFKTISANARVETHIDIRLGRDEEQMLESGLPPRSVVVIGARSGWWPTRERRIAKRLTRRGHQVVLAHARSI